MLTPSGYPIQVPPNTHPSGLSHNGHYLDHLHSWAPNTRLQATGVDFFGLRPNPQEGCDGKGKETGRENGYE
jgi:hypothetical protein